MGEFSRMTHQRHKLHKHCWSNVEWAISQLSIKKMTSAFLDNSHSMQNKRTFNIKNRQQLFVSTTFSVQPMLITFQHDISLRKSHQREKTSKGPPSSRNKHAQLVVLSVNVFSLTHLGPSYFHRLFFLHIWTSPLSDFGYFHGHPFRNDKQFGSRSDAELFGVCLLDLNWLPFNRSVS